MCTGVEWPGTFGVLLILVGQYISLENPAGGMTLEWPYHAASMTVHCRRARCVWPCALILQWAYGHSWPYASEGMLTRDHTRGAEWPCAAIPKGLIDSAQPSLAARTTN